MSEGESAEGIQNNLYCLIKKNNEILALNNNLLLNNNILLNNLSDTNKYKKKYNSLSIKYNELNNKYKNLLQEYNKLLKKKEIKKKSKFNKYLKPLI